MKLDFKGFQNFKLNLSQDLVLEPSKVDNQAANNLDNMVEALTQTYKQLDYMQFNNRLIKLK